MAEFVREVRKRETSRTPDIDDPERRTLQRVRLAGDSVPARS